MKQRLHFLMALVLALCLTAPALAAGFTDVPDSHWASGYIQRAYEEDWVHGMGGGKYAPAGTLTRAQFLTMVTNAFFSDDLDKVSVPDGSPWYAACWSVAQANGLQTGTSMERLSDLTDSVSRYDMAQVIVNTLSGEGISASDSEARAAQAAIRDWSGVPAGYRDAVSGAYALGILNGRNGSFDGTATMNRAEAATVLCRMDDAISGAQTPDTQKPDTQKPDTQTPDTQKPDTQKPDTQKPDTQKPETQPPAQDASTPEELAAEVVRLVNVERAKEGLAPLGTYDSLTKAAQIRAPEIVTLFSHDRPDGTSCFTAMDQTGAKKGAYTWGENIAAGNATAAATVEQWMNSPGHRANILNAKFTHIGVGYQHSAGSTYGHYWVQMFTGTSSVPDSPGTGTQTPSTQPPSTQKPDTQKPDTQLPSSGEGGILFSCPTITLYPGGTYSLSVLEHNMRSASGVTWANESPDLLRLNGNGSSVTALAERGTGYLTASRNGETIRLTVRIIPTADQIALSCLSTTMSVDGYGSTELYVFSTSRFYNQDCTVTWTVDDPSILTLEERTSSAGNPSVRFQAHRTGDACITCRVTMADGSTAEEYCFAHVR